MAGSKILTQDVQRAPTMYATPARDGDRGGFPSRFGRDAFRDQSVMTTHAGADARHVQAPRATALRAPEVVPAANGLIQARALWGNTDQLEAHINPLDASRTGAALKTLSAVARSSDVAETAEIGLAKTAAAKAQTKIDELKTTQSKLQSAIKFSVLAAVNSLLVSAIVSLLAGPFAVIPLGVALGFGIIAAAAGIWAFVNIIQQRYARKALDKADGVVTAKEIDHIAQAHRRDDVQATFAADHLTKLSAEQQREGFGTSRDAMTRASRERAMDPRTLILRDDDVDAGEEYSAPQSMGRSRHAAFADAGQGDRTDVVRQPSRSVRFQVPATAPHTDFAPLDGRGGYGAPGQGQYSSRSGGYASTAAVPFGRGSVPMMPTSMAYGSGMHVVEDDEPVFGSAPILDGMSSHHRSGRDDQPAEQHYSYTHTVRRDAQRSPTDMSFPMVDMSGTHGQRMESDAQHDRGTSHPQHGSRHHGHAPTHHHQSSMATTSFMGHDSRSHDRRTQHDAASTSA